MSQFNHAGKQTSKPMGNQSVDKAKGPVAPSGGKPAEPLLKPKAQTLPMKK
jgi:hypothetical protein